MKFLSALLVAALFSSCAMKPTQDSVARQAASTPGHLSAEGFAHIDLTGIAIMNNNEKTNAMLYKVSLDKSVTDVIAKDLLKETGADYIVSKIFSAQASNGRTIYVFITKLNFETTYALQMLSRDKKGKVSHMIDFEVVGAQQNLLEVVNGPQNEMEGYTVTSGKMLYPF